MDPRRVRSITLVKEIVRDERSAQLAHFDALDTKAGVILGFAGVLVALSPSGRSIWVGLGKLGARRVSGRRSSVRGAAHPGHGDPHLEVER